MVRIAPRTEGATPLQADFYSLPDREEIASRIRLRERTKYYLPTPQRTT